VRTVAAVVMAVMVALITAERDGGGVTRKGIDPWNVLGQRAERSVNSINRKQGEK